MSTNEPTAPSADPSEAVTAGANAEVRQNVLEALKVVFDPEIPVNIVDLGLVYDVAIEDGGRARITMTLTTMGCPAQDMIRTDAEVAAMTVDDVSSAEVEIVWSPPWSLQRMTDDGKRQMRMFGFNV